MTVAPSHRVRSPRVPSLEPAVDYETYDGRRTVKKGKCTTVSHARHVSPYDRCSRHWDDVLFFIHTTYPSLPKTSVSPSQAVDSALRFQDDTVYGNKNDPRGVQGSQRSKEIMLGLPFSKAVAHSGPTNRCPALTLNGTTYDKRWDDPYRKPPTTTCVKAIISRKLSSNMECMYLHVRRLRTAYIKRKRPEAAPAARQWADTFPRFSHCLSVLEPSRLPHPCSGC